MYTSFVHPPGRALRASKTQQRMDAPMPSRRPWFDLRAAVILGFLALVACFVAWKWSESHSRDRCLSDLDNRGATISVRTQIDEWSGEWPFQNTERVTRIVLRDDRFNDDDLHRLRKLFARVPIYHMSLESFGRDAARHIDLINEVELPSCLLIPPED
jgi:hypothetical protein